MTQATYRVRRRVLVCVALSELISLKIVDIVYESAGMVSQARAAGKEFAWQLSGSGLLIVQEAAVHSVTTSPHGEEAARWSHGMDSAPLNFPVLIHDELNTRYEWLACLGSRMD